MVHLVSCGGKQSVSKTDIATTWKGRTGLLKERLGSLELGKHGGKLGSDDRLLDESLAKYLALVSPLEALLDDEARSHARSTAHDPTLESRRNESVKCTSGEMREERRTSWLKLERMT